MSCMEHAAVLGPRRDYKPYHGPRRTTTGALVRHAHAAAHHACHNPHHGVRPRTTPAPANIRVAASFGLVSWSLRRRRQDAALVAQPAAPGAPLPTYGRRHQARPLEGTRVLHAPPGRWRGWRETAAGHACPPRATRRAARRQSNTPSRQRRSVGGPGVCGSKRVSGAARGGLEGEARGLRHQGPREEPRPHARPRVAHQRPAPRALVKRGAGSVTCRSRVT